MKKNKLLKRTKHLSLYITDKGFVYAQRRSVNSVAGLVYSKKDNDFFFLIHYQPMPEIEEKKHWDQCYPCCITGSIEKNETPEKTIIKEVFEEGGIKIKKEHIKNTKMLIATTQMNEKVFHFLVDATGLKQENPVNDGTIFESVSYNKWLSLKEVEKIINNEICLSSLDICFNMFKEKIWK